MTTTRTISSMSAAAAAAYTAIVVALSGCSHSGTAYISPDITDTATQGIPIDPGAVRTRVLLIGDAGQPVPDEPALVDATRWASEFPERTTVVFLGDNVYPWGLADELEPEMHKTTTRRLSRQTDVVSKSGARGILIPGNHDWGHGGPDGLIALERQERAVEALLGPNAFIPSGGCLGPEAVDLDGVRLVIFDSQWFVQKEPASPCPDTEASFSAELSRLVAEAGDREVFVLAHHTIATHGPHGGFFDWKDHIFPLTRLAPWAYVPLPVVGSLYPFFRGTLNVSSQDIGSGRYDRYVSVVSEAVRAHRPLLFAAGHDHSLQVLEGDAFQYALVSGAGAAARISIVSHGDDTLFAHAHPGFMCVDLLNDGRVALRVVEPNNGVVFSRWLTDGG